MQEKLDWVPHHFSKLKDILLLLRADEPASRAAGLLKDVASTSADGDRPKVTIQDNSRMLLVEMQARSDIELLTHKEFVVIAMAMAMAGACGIYTPPVRLEFVGEHAVYLCERFDRDGNADDHPRNHGLLFQAGQMKAGARF